MPRIWDDEGHYEKLLSSAKDILMKEKKERERPASAVSAQGQGENPKDSQMEEFGLQVSQRILFLNYSYRLWSF